MGRLPIKNPSKKTIQLLLCGRFMLSFDQLEFHLTNLPIRKRLNLLAQGFQMALRSVNRIGVPPILQIEPVNACNLGCLTCATGSGIMKRSANMMPFKMFKNVIDQVKDNVCLLVFWSWGEPFIHRDAFRMIRYAKDRDLLIHTSTNGHFFNTRESARKVVDSGLDSLIVAVDGLDQPTYEKYRKGGKLEVVIKSIENIVSERSNLGAKNPLITFRFIVMKHNEHQIDEVKNFAEKLGVDVVTFRSAVINRGEIKHDNDLTPNEFEYIMHDPMTKTQPQMKYYRSCNRPYANLTIFSDGTIVACEEDYDAMFPMGNVRDQTLHKIVNSFKFKQFLKMFRKNPKNYSFCQTCDLLNSKYKTHNVNTYILNQEIYDYVCRSQKSFAQI